MNSNYCMHILSISYAQQLFYTRNTLFCEHINYVIHLIIIHMHNRLSNMHYTYSMRAIHSCSNVDSHSTRRVGAVGIRSICWPHRRVSTSISSWADRS